MADDLNSAADEFFQKRGRSAPQGGASQIPGLTLEDEAAAFFENRKKQQAEGKPDVKARPPATPLSDFKGQTLKFGPWDTGLELNPGVARGLAQTGSGFADMILGAKRCRRDEYSD